MGMPALGQDLPPCMPGGGEKVACPYFSWVCRNVPDAPKESEFRRRGADAPFHTQRVNWLLLPLEDLTAVGLRFPPCHLGSVKSPHCEQCAPHRTFRRLLASQSAAPRVLREAESPSSRVDDAGTQRTQAHCLAACHPMASRSQGFGTTCY